VDREKLLGTSNPQATDDAYLTIEQWHLNHEKELQVGQNGM